jgi:subtilisin family serine protease
MTPAVGIGLAETSQRLHAGGAVARPNGGAGAFAGCCVAGQEGTEQRVLIELRARPFLDSAARGSVGTISAQQTQLEQDFLRIDAELGATSSRITRRYSLLFAGVAATVNVAVRERLRQLPYVAAVHEDESVHAMLADSVPLVGAPTVWSTYGVTGVGVKVAILDTGIDYTHPDLGGCFGSGCKVVGGYDFVNNDNDPSDDHGHGTHVAGIIAANGTLKGVAPGATLLAYKVLDRSGSGSSSDIIAALERAVADGAGVANLSLGGSGYPDDPISRAVDNADAAGMLCVVAAGNSGSGYQTVESPGVARSALTVGATDKSDQIASYSSRGPVDIGGGAFLIKPEMVAPGSTITSTIRGGGYGAMSGTSMATPHVAGAAALVR